MFNTNHQRQREMELRQLKYFISAAEARNFSRAARQLFVSQSALSQQIKLLEDELHTKLFIRTNHNVCLTESGIELLPLAINIIQNVAACRERINELKHLMYGELKIGVTYTLEPCIREAMLCFMRAHPNIMLKVYYKNVTELLNELHHNQIDIIFSFMPIEKHDFIESIQLATHRLMAAMRRSHPLATKSLITQTDLQHQRLILPETGLSEHDTICYYLQAEVKDMHICCSINNAHAILNLLQDSNYISILTQSTIMSNPNICAIPIEHINKPIKSYAHLNKNTPRKHSIEAFIKEFTNTNAFYIIRHT